MKASWRVFIVTVLMGSFLVSDVVVSGKKESKRVPHGCFQQGYQFDYFHVIFTPTAKFHPQTVYFVHNVSKRSVKLFQSREGNEPYVMHINTTIIPKRWSVYATDEKKSKFICAVKNKKGLHDQVIDCSKVLDVCEFPWTRFGDNHRGNYWALTNRSKSGAFIGMRYHGVVLIDSKKRKQDQ